MKKWTFLFVIIFLVGCTKPPQILPDLEGLNETEIRSAFYELDIAEIQIVERNYVVLAESKQFIEYGNDLMAGDLIEDDALISVIVSADLVNRHEFYVFEEVIYDGPELLDLYFQKPYAIEIEDGYIGGGRAFEVGLQNNGCVDGDTARFVLPNEMVDYTNNPYVSVRFLNFDTAETFDGGKEEFGKPASNYTCDLLTQADAIYLQTDPGDNLFDRYGRLLAWIWIEVNSDIQLLNYMLVRQGLGEVMYLYGAGETVETMVGGMTYTEWMFEAERLAKLEKLGIYSGLKDIYWDYVTDSPNPATWTD